MSEAAHKMVDEELDELEKRLSKFYSRAADELEKKAEAYFDRFQKRDAEKKKLVDDEKMTQEQYNAWRQGQMMTGQRWKDFRAQAARSLTDANKHAVDIMNGRLPEIYAMNFNEVGKEGEKVVKGIAFDLVNKDTVAYLAKKDQNLLPYKEIDGKKYVRWNEKQITSEVMQGILQGESVDKLARRFRDVTDMNRESSIRNARTTFTSAENKGTLDGMDRLSKMGLIVKKQWLATHDKRVRDSHLQCEADDPVDLDKTFSNGLMYPGDPDGRPEEVYNCRCSLETVIVGYNGMMFDEREEQRQGHFIADGEDITETWERRENEFDYAIEDVMNKQGFDGAPKIVSAEEFNEIAKENEFIAQRTYSAQDQETLDSYREQLYSGKWYVDCGEGGAVYGQGMYACASNDGTISQHMKNEMEHYMSFNASKLGGDGASNEMKIEMIESYVKSHNLTGDKADAVRTFLKSQTGVERPSKDGISLVKSVLGNEGMRNLRTDAMAINSSHDNARSFIETFTLDKSAKIISYEDLTKLAYSDEAFSSMSKAKSNDLGVFAAIKGYDAIYVKSQDYVVVLNRTKMIINGGV